MRSVNIRYLPQIDHLRALAAVWIVLYHGLYVIGPTFAPKDIAAMAHSVPTLNPLYALWAEGHTAVALFMVLSGFIFTVGSFGKALSYKDFLINRVLRIYPLFVAVLMLDLSNDRATRSVSDLVTTLLPLADFRWDQGQVLVPMAWAVSVEFQFYLLYPYLLGFLNRAPLKTTASIIAVALAFRVLGIGVWYNPRDLSYYHLIGRIDQFALGMFAATLFLRWDGRRRLFSAVFGIAAPATVLLLWGFQGLGGLDTAPNWKILWPTLEGAAWSAVVLGYVGMGQRLGPVVSKLVGWVGEMSFSIYLLHRWVLDVFAFRPWIELRLTRTWDMDALLTTVLLVLPVTLASSWITFNVVEKPFLGLRRKYALPARDPEWRQAFGGLAPAILGGQAVSTVESVKASAEPVARAASGWSATSPR